MIILALAAAASLAPRPSELHTYKDWIVGCDNIRSCQANALMPEDGDSDDYLMLTLHRDGGPGDGAMLNVPLPDNTAPGSRFVLKVDGAAVVSFSAPKGSDAQVALTAALASSLVAGQRVALFDGRGSKVGGASLAGLSAALLYVDDQQHRVGTRSALKATGSKAATKAPAPAPLILTPASDSRPPRTISVALASQLIGPDAAVCDNANGKVVPLSYRLDAAHSLVLVDNPCGNGAYNFFTSVYVLGQSGPPAEAMFDIAPGMGDTAGVPGTGVLTNGEWDPKTRRLTSYEKGRGIGDCGSNESYAWDGRQFRLVEQTLMSECRGSIDYIRTWTAQTQ